MRPNERAAATTAASSIGRVDRPVLGGLRDGHDPRLARVLETHARDRALDERRGKLAVGRGDGEQLATRESFGRPALVGVDVRRRGQMTASKGRISAWSAVTLAPVPLKTKNGSACAPKCSLHELARPGGHRIVAIGVDMALIGFSHRGEHRRMRTRRVVARETARVRPSLIDHPPRSRSGDCATAPGW